MHASLETMHASRSSIGSISMHNGMDAAHDVSSLILIHSSDGLYRSNGVGVYIFIIQALDTLAGSQACIMQ
jgi:hypothetical protein